MAGFSIAAWFILLVQILLVALIGLGVYALILVIKVLKIYIRKNGGY